MKKVIVKTKEELINIIANSHPLANLNHLDISNLTDLSYVFSNEFTKDFNGDISEWDTSNVVNMCSMFKNSSFNGDISNWNVSNVKNMNSMFYNSRFKGDISNWNVSKVEDMSMMFCLTEFSGDLSKWNVSNVKYMSRMFAYSYFKGKICFTMTRKDNNVIFNFSFGSISNWDVSNVKNMDHMFYNSLFEDDISNWNVKSLENCNNMFDGCNLLYNNLPNWYLNFKPKSSKKKKSKTE